MGFRDGTDTGEWPNVSPKIVKKCFGLKIVVRIAGVSGSDEAACSRPRRIKNVVLAIGNGEE